MKILKQLAYLPAISSSYRLDLIHVSMGFVRNRLQVSYMSSNNYNNAVRDNRNNSPGRGSNYMSSSSRSSGNESNNRKYLKIPFDRKDEVKMKGGRWDPEKKMWYMTGNYDEFSQWIVSDNMVTDNRSEFTSLPSSSPRVSTPPPPAIQAVVKATNIFDAQPAAAAAAVVSLSPEGKRFLTVPFEDKDEVKRRGGRWDMEAKKWYISQYTPIKDFEEWLVDPIFLDVPFDEKNTVKELGARWDIAAKKWCILPNVKNAYEFERWVPIELRSTLKQFQQETNQAIMNIPNNLVMFIDIETSGLPLKTNSYEDDSPVKYDNARAIQLNMITCDRESFAIVDFKSYLIKSDGFPIDNSEIHGITLKRSLTEGLEFDEVITDFKKYLQNTSLLLAHNADFDVKILKNELKVHKKLDILDLLESIETQCTMELTKPMVGLLNKVGSLKNPSLKELYEKATKRTIDPTRLEDRKNSVKHLYDAIKQLIDDKKIAL